MTPKIALSTQFWNSPIESLKSGCTAPPPQVLEYVQQCWHFAEPFHRKGSVRVPVPPTIQSASVFQTNVYKLNTPDVAMELGIVPILGDAKVMIPVARPAKRNQKAKFAEVILYRRDSLAAPTTPPDTEWEAVFYRALPEKVVPMHPLHMAVHVAQKPEMWDYTTEDWRAATEFWSQYAIGM